MHCNNCRIICRYLQYAPLQFSCQYMRNHLGMRSLGPFMETGFFLFHLFISISHCEVYSKQRTRYVFSYDPLQRRFDTMSRRLRIGEYGQRWILYWIDSFIRTAYSWLVCASPLLARLESVLATGSHACLYGMSYAGC